MPILEIKSFRGGLSDYEDKGIAGAFKHAANLDIRKLKDTITAGQALIDIGTTAQSASASVSPSASVSFSPSASISPSASPSPSPASPSASTSPSASHSPSASVSPSASLSPSSSVSPSPSPTAGLSTVFSDLIRWFVKCSDGFIYGFGSTGKVYQINPADNSVKQVYDLRKPIVGAEEKPSSGGKTYLLFATATELHRKEIPGQNSWNDVDKPGLVQGDSWPKTNLTTSDYHTMAQVGGDVMIANGSFLAMAAYDDSYTNEALDLIPGNIVKTVVERNGRAVVGTYRKADPTKGVNGMVDSEVPLVQVGDLGDIYYSDFVNSIAVKRLPGGGKVNPGGMVNEIDHIDIFDWEQTALSWIDKQTIGNMALMGVYGASSGKGGVYTFGRRDKNHPFVLNLEYLLDADELGAVASRNGLVYVSYRLGSTFGVMVTDPTRKAMGLYEGLDFKAPVKMPMSNTVWEWAELYMDPLPSGTSVQFWYKIDKTGPFRQAKTDDGLTDYVYTTGRRALFRIKEKGEIFEPRVITTPNGNTTPEIHRIRVGFV